MSIMRGILHPHSRAQGFQGRQMIDNFALLLSHALVAIAFWRLLQRPDLDREPPARSAGDNSADA